MAPAEPAAAVSICVALSFNGRTDDSDSSNRGSNPWGATKRNKTLRGKSNDTLHHADRAVLLKKRKPLNHAVDFDGPWRAGR